MAFNIIQKAVRYTKQVQDVGLFGTMVKSRWFLAFAGSPLYYVMLPLIGILMTVLAIMDGYNLAKDPNRNFDKWFGFIVSVISAACASVSLYGAVIATYLGVSFVAGPWIFFSSLIVASVHQLVMLGIHLFRAYNLPNNSPQHRHNIEAAINNILVISLLVAALGAVTLVMLFPIAPVIASVFASAVVVLTVLDVVWQIAPENWRLLVKEFILGKPELVLQTISHGPLKYDIKLEVEPMDVHKLIAANHTSFFSTTDYGATISTLAIGKDEQFLQEVIGAKLKVLAESPNAASTKNTQKAGFLNDLLTHVKHQQTISKPDLLKKYPLALQDFWADKGDVEQILDAAVVMQKRHVEHNFERVARAEQSLAQ